MTEESIKAYWQKFLDTLPDDSPYHTKPYIAEGWGDGPTMADELGALIVQGTKTATCSALWEWEAEGNPIPEVGYLTIALDGGREPLCIVETLEFPFANIMRWRPILPMMKVKATCLWITGAKPTGIISRASFTKQAKSFQKKCRSSVSAFE